MARGDIESESESDEEGSDGSFTTDSDDDGKESVILDQVQDLPNIQLTIQQDTRTQTTIAAIAKLQAFLDKEDDALLTTILTGNTFTLNLNLIIPAELEGKKITGYKTSAGGATEKSDKFKTPTFPVASSSTAPAPKDNRQITLTQDNFPAFDASFLTEEAKARLIAEATTKINAEIKRLKELTKPTGEEENVAREGVTVKAHFAPWQADGEHEPKKDDFNEDTVFDVTFANAFAVPNQANITLNQALIVKLDSKRKKARLYEGETLIAKATFERGQAEKINFKPKLAYLDQGTEKKTVDGALKSRDLDILNSKLDFKITLADIAPDKLTLELVTEQKVEEKDFKEYLEELFPSNTGTQAAGNFAFALNKALHQLRDPVFNVLKLWMNKARSTPGITGQNSDETFISEFNAFVKDTTNTGFVKLVNNEIKPIPETLTDAQRTAIASITADLLFKKTVEELSSLSKAINAHLKEKLNADVNTDTFSPKATAITLDLANLSTATFGLTVDDFKAETTTTITTEAVVGTPEIVPVVVVVTPRQPKQVPAASQKRVREKDSESEEESESESDSDSDSESESESDSESESESESEEEGNDWLWQEPIPARRRVPPPTAVPATAPYVGTVTGREKLYKEYQLNEAINKNPTKKELEAEEEKQRQLLAGAYIADFYKNEKGQEARIDCRLLGNCPIRIFQGKGAELEFEKILNDFINKSKGSRNRAVDGRDSYKNHCALVAVEVNGKLDYRLITYNKEKDVVTTEKVSEDFLQKTIGHSTTKSKVDFADVLLAKTLVNKASKATFTTKSNEEIPEITFNKKATNSTFTQKVENSDKGTTIHLVLVSNKDGKFNQNNEKYFKFTELNGKSLMLKATFDNAGKASIDYKNIYEERRSGQGHSYLEKNALTALPKMQDQLQSLMNKINFDVITVTQNSQSTNPSVSRTNINKGVAKDSTNTLTATFTDPKTTVSKPHSPTLKSNEAAK